VESGTSVKVAVVPTIPVWRSPVDEGFEHVAELLVISLTL
jgi:hypothetical protein